MEKRLTYNKHQCNKSKYLSVDVLMVMDYLRENKIIIFSTFLKSLLRIKIENKLYYFRLHQEYNDLNNQLLSLFGHFQLEKSVLFLETFKLLWEKEIDVSTLQSKETDIIEYLLRYNIKTRYIICETKKLVIINENN